MVFKWLDFHFDPGRGVLDAEWRGVDFLPAEHPARRAWPSFWPQTGNVPNWDAVGVAEIGGREEWLLVEAKAHVGELRSSCGAQPDGGLPKIRRALDATKAALGVDACHDWLHPYYQCANRVAVLSFLLSHSISARLLFIYFLGDRNQGQVCPARKEEWDKPLRDMAVHLGLQGQTELEQRIQRVFLHVCPPQP